MKATRKAIGVLMAMVVSLSGVAARGAELWVAPDGDDASSGTKESPLASPALALRKARDLRRTNSPVVQEGVHIVLRGGIYPLMTPLAIRPNDSGTASSPTIIEAAPGEQPVLSGGVAVANWRKLEGNVPGLPEAAKGQVWVAEAPRVQGRVLECRQLWVKDQKAVRARTPNGATCARLTAWDAKTQTVAIPAALTAALQARGADLERSRIELVQQQQWEIAFLRVKGFVAPPGSPPAAAATGAVPQVGLAFQQPESRLEFEHPWPQPVLQSKGGGGAFFLANALEFLDEPGEWYEEISAMGEGRIYYWPRAGEEITKERAMAPVLETLVEVTGSLDQPVAFVSFKGIGFAYAGWKRPAEAGHVPLQAGMALEESYKLRPVGTADAPGLDNQDWIVRMPAAVTVRGAHDTRFERCRFEHTAASGLDYIWGTHDNVIEGNLFRDVGGNGIQMGSFQEGATETHIPYNPKDEREVCTRERIANNLVTDAANEDWGCVGICVGYGREITIAHNEVSNVSYTGISLGWGWTKVANAMRDNRVHANLLDQVATRMCDTAGIYTLSAQAGTTITENRVDHIQMSPYVDRPDHWFYLYTDEGSSNITLRDNWCPTEKFLKNANGPGNVWQNNGPMVDEQIKKAAGLEAVFQDLLTQRTPAK